MTEGGLAQQSPEPAQPLAPAPLPIPEPPAPRRRAALIAVVLMFVLLACAAVAYVTGVLAGLPIPSPFPSLTQLLGEPIYEGQWWAGDGDYAVATFGDAGEAPRVVVWERRTGETRTLSGYRAVVVEPHAPRAWLVAEKEIETSDWGGPGDLPGDAYDTPASGLLLLKLDDRDLLAKAPDSFEWQPWDNADGSVSARLTIDPAKGANPSSLAFTHVKDAESEATGRARLGDTRRAQGGRKVVRARLAESASTFTMKSFEPVGWSPSGRYFAIRPLGSSPEENGYEVGASMAVVVVDSTDGKVTAALPANLPYGMPSDGIAWDSERDRLYVAGTEWSTDSDGAGVFQLTYLDADGDAGDAFSLPGWSRPPGLSRIDYAHITGEDTRGPILGVSELDETQLWRIEPDGLERAGRVESASIGSWKQPHGMLYLQREGEHFELRLAAPGKRQGRLLWREKE